VPHFVGYQGMIVVGFAHSKRLCRKTSLTIIRIEKKRHVYQLGKERLIT
jgi:hypothetical protein